VPVSSREQPSTPAARGPGVAHEWSGLLLTRKSRAESACRPGLDPGTLLPRSMVERCVLTCGYDLGGSRLLWSDVEAMCPECARSAPCRPGRYVNAPPLDANYGSAADGGRWRRYVVCMAGADHLMLARLLHGCLHPGDVDAWRQ